MSFEDLSDIYYRSAVYQFMFFFYCLIMISYTQEHLVIMYASILLAGFNLFFLLSTVNEYKKKKRLYTENEQVEMTKA